ncbi:MAG: hypothetical protein U0796_09350 [Gemmatales bacterium]
MRMYCFPLLTLAWMGLVGLVAAQQPPAKTATTQPPGKTAEKPPEKMAEKTAPAKAPVTKSNANVEHLVTFTADGVRIEGDFYPPAESKAKTAPCIILLHAIGPRNLTASRADFGKLPERLQKLGYAVVAIDLRGYGKSKTVESQFWNSHRPKNRNLELIEAKDYSSSSEMLEMVYDLTAVKIWLNIKNNAKECNSHAVAVIALEQSGLIAMAWAANEHADPNRVKVRSVAGGLPNQNGFGNQGFGNQGNTGFGNQGFGNQGNTGTGNQRQPGSIVPRFEGEDITCIVPISTSHRLNEAINLGYLERWVTFLRDHQVATMAIYGAQDKEASAFWAKAGLWARPAGDKFRFKNSGVKPVKGTSLTGAKLLSNDTLDVPKMLEDYLAEALKKPAESRLWAEQTGQDRPTPIELQRLFR